MDKTRRKPRENAEKDKEQEKRKRRANNSNALQPRGATSLQLGDAGSPLEIVRMLRRGCADFDGFEDFPGLDDVVIRSMVTGTIIADALKTPGRVIFQDAAQLIALVLTRGSSIARSVEMFSLLYFGWRLCAASLR